MQLKKNGESHICYFYMTPFEKKRGHSPPTLSPCTHRSLYVPDSVREALDILNNSFCQKESF